MITAKAQPVPASTLIAEAGQFLAQAPHSIQLFLSAITAFMFSMAKTPWGHTSVHFPHPVHFPGERFSVTTFFRYLCFIASPLSRKCLNQYQNNAGYNCQNYQGNCDFHFFNHTGEGRIGGCAGKIQREKRRMRRKRKRIPYPQK